MPVDAPLRFAARLVPRPGVEPNLRRYELRARAADMLHARTGIPDFRFQGLMGLEDCDALTDTLSSIAQCPVPPRIERHRNQLLDAMVDCHFHLNGIPAAIDAVRLSLR